MFMKKNKNNTNAKFFQLKDKLSYKEIIDNYYLDCENVIATDIDDRIIHYRLVGDELVEMNSWNGISVLFTCHPLNINGYSLVEVAKGYDSLGMIYDYKNAKVVIPFGMWHNISHASNYEGFLASFTISSLIDDNDTIRYQNMLTNEWLEEKFQVSDGTYYAIINYDGTIRGNKLFKGETFAKTTEIIDLDEYESLEDFKKQRIARCTELKDRQVAEYQQKIAAREDNNLSPYLDKEVAQILKLRKKIE